MRKREQLSVPLDAELREFVERAAESEDRPAAAWVRRLIAQAARKVAHHAEPRERAA